MEKCVKCKEKPKAKNQFMCRECKNKASREKYAKKKEGIVRQKQILEVKEELSSILEILKRCIQRIEE